MTSPTDIRAALIEHLSDDIVCERLTADGERLSCLTPLQYPDGDNVEVWIDRPLAGQFLVTDEGQASLDFSQHPPQDMKALSDGAIQIAREWGLRFHQGRLSAEVDAPEIAEATWRVASASEQLAHLALYYQPRRRKRERGFAVTVESDIRSRQIEVERERKLEGSSGHPHRATIYLPEHEVVMEPVAPHAHWNLISTVYTKFGDLRTANGYHLMSVVDDREGRLPTDIENMLVQVGSVVDWSQRDAWLSKLR
jgi:hypothetical protein